MALLLLLAGAATLWAQPGQPFVDSVDVQVVEVDVVVTDRKDRPVKGLKREDFELYVDGQPVEITNFFESAIYIEGQNRRRGKERPILRAQPSAGTTDEGPLTVVFYLEEPNIFPPHRTRLMRRLEAAVEPWRSLGAHFLLARFNHRLEILVPPTSELDAILEGAATVPKGSPRAIRNGTGARRLAIRQLIRTHEACVMARFCDPCEDNWGELLSLARQYADGQATNAAIAADGLADLVTTLGGMPGKKAVVYITDGLPQRPGISVLDFLGNGLCADLRRTAPSETMAEMVQYDESRRLSRISAHANANRVTFYGLDAAGLRSASADISLDIPGAAPDFQNVTLQATNAQSGLRLLAHDTGGKALINANDLSILLDDMTGQLAASYSLGFMPAERKPGEARQVAVLLAPGAGKNRTIRYRRSYRDKSPRGAAGRTVAFRRLPRQHGQPAAKPNVDLGGHESSLEKDRSTKLTVGVGVPVESDRDPARATDGAAPNAGRL